MENFSILVPLLSVYFLVIASGCAESPAYDAPKRCCKLRYGSVVCTLVVLLAMFVSSLFTSSNPEHYKIAWPLFLLCDIPAIVVTFIGLYEVKQKRGTELKNFEANLATGFLSSSIFMQVAYLIYWLVA